MKTPMQEHIEWLKKEKDEHGYEKHPYFECAIEHAESMLEKEKALLIKTHGNKKVYDSQIDPTIVTGEEWYDKTFNTKER
jgi:hypothetical protein